MAKLTPSARKALPKSDFAVPGKRAYPIENEAHGRDALARVSANGSPKEKSEVKSQVEAKFPDMDVGGGKHEPKAEKGESKGGVPRGGHHQANHRAPNNHAEFETLGKPVKGDEYC